MAWIIRGRTWRFGDDIAASLIVPGPFIIQGPEAVRRHVLFGVDPTFASRFEPGGVIVAGRNFGCESSREIATQVLKDVGVALIIARSFGRIFYRNAIALALPCLVLNEVDLIPDQAVLEADFETGRIRLETDGKLLQAEPPPPFLLSYIKAGGVLPYLRARLPDFNT